MGDVFGQHADGPGLARFCLARLRRFAGLAYGVDAGAVPGWARLARHATLTAYRDCCALGLDRAARAILRHHGGAGHPGSVLDPAAAVRQEAPPAPGSPAHAGKAEHY